MEKIATKQYSETVSIVGGKKEHIHVELTDNVKQIRYNKKMKRYNKNVSKRKADDNKYTSIIVKKIINPMAMKNPISINMIGDVATKYKLPNLGNNIKYKLIKSDINPKHNAIPAKVEDVTSTYKKPEHVILPKNISIAEKEHTPMTRDIMNRGIVEAKMKKWDKKRNMQIESAPAEQRAFLVSITPEQRKNLYKVLCDKYDIKPKLSPSINKKNLKYGVVIICDYENSKGIRKSYKPFVNYHISTKEYAEKLLQQKVDYFKSYMKNKHHFVTGHLLYGGERLMFNIKASYEEPKEQIAA